MLSRLIDFVINFWSDLWPTFIINAYEAGIILRFGKYSRTVHAGLHWKIPFIDRILVDNIVPATKNLAPQSVVTLEGRPIVISAVITYGIKDVEKFLLTIEDADAVLLNSAYGIISAAVQASSWEDITKPEFSEILYREIRKKAHRWGVDVIDVSLSALVPARSYRLWSSEGTSLKIIS